MANVLRSQTTSEIGLYWLFIDFKKFILSLGLRSGKKLTHEANSFLSLVNRTKARQLLSAALRGLVYAPESSPYQATTY